ncbi:conserved hypothetical protein [Culex quinquefasciatus]|uniref:Uncharacterized protein n=1 Tax=Culex quinquefasciatus TaxID=7176 RepID=B0WLA0_CULQU|nr:conserved hypothetical protein [Culex quinquefasciatus]|eukprot:XP_001849484.1 conserved hypothetical protein [Culex quinquefasciatus]
MLHAQSSATADKQGNVCQTHPNIPALICAYRIRAVCCIALKGGLDSNHNTCNWPITIPTIDDSHDSRG